MNLESFNRVKDWELKNFPGQHSFQENQILFELKTKKEIIHFSDLLFSYAQKKSYIGEIENLNNQFIIKYIEYKTLFYPEKINFSFSFEEFSWKELYNKFFRELFILYWEQETDEEMKLRIKDLFLES
jgi:hypothetical protein